MIETCYFKNVVILINTYEITLNISVVTFSVIVYVLQSKAVQISCNSPKIDCVCGN